MIAFGDFFKYCICESWCFCHHVHENQSNFFAYYLLFMFFQLSPSVSALNHFNQLYFLTVRLFIVFDLRTCPPEYTIRDYSIAWNESLSEQCLECQIWSYQMVWLMRPFWDYMIWEQWKFGSLDTRNGVDLNSRTSFFSSINIVCGWGKKSVNSALDPS